MKIHFPFMREFGAHFANFFISLNNTLRQIANNNSFANVKTALAQIANITHIVRCGILLHG